MDVASHAAQLADLLDAVDTGREPAVTGQDGRDALEIVLAVYESSRTGRPVRPGRPMTVILSGFADEISPDPRAQLATLAAESITHLELRSAWSVNVADFTGEQLAAFRAALDDAGVRVSAIGSPIGKIPVGAPLGPELDRMRRVADVAGRARHHHRPRLLLLHARGRAAGAVPRARSSTAWAPWPGSPRSAAWSSRTRTRRRSTATSRTGAPT